MKCCSGDAAYKSLVKKLSGGQHGVKTLLTRSFPLFEGLYILLRASLVVQMVKNLPAIQETWVRSLTQEDLLEKEWVTHSSILSWRIPWTASSYCSWGRKESDMTQ